MENNKIKKEINDVVNNNLKALEQLFPSAVKDGQLDIKALKEELGDFEEVGIERYELNWAGKQNAKKVVQQGIGNKTLKFVEKDSKNADTTENIYIEGDNLEVLKLLRQNYYNSIKMIYIDPPYNTGNDFVYKDKDIMPKKDSDEAEGFINEVGEKLEKNPKSTNRYHANWLNMMYPRLKLARDLLTDDGVIFISIDDNEQANLKRLCDEIFGEENNIGNIAWRRFNSQANVGIFAKIKDTILIYSKNKDLLSFGRLPLSEKAKKEYQYRDEKGIYARRPCIDSVRGKNRFNVKLPNGNILTGPWILNEEEFIELEKRNLIHWPQNGGNPMRKIYLEEAIKKGQISSDFWDSEYGNNKTSAEEIKKLFNIRIFDFSKPLKLLFNLISLGMSNKNDIILDFFSGSATTAHAVMQLNSEDNGNRKYIMVQLPETTDEKSEAFKAGYKNIAEIGKERIRRAGEKIKQEIDEYNSNLKLGEEPKKVPDIGFKVFKVDDTNIKWYDLENFNEESQYSFDDPDSLDFVLGSNDIDIVYEIMLRQNDVPLSERSEVLTDIGNRTYLCASTYLICLETEITEKMVEKLALLEPLPIKFVFRDSAFKDNISLKDETFRKLRSLIERNSGESKISYRVEFI
ncbi:site-specific DNA-methyltransferase [Leptotrichia sp.]|uniref:site-specific DNA-methyltransferase n=1 Tax=Leptotrichia sp. TaxID=104608 RepID=UPI00185CE8C3|nr:site-specific DNA-methyltransferase [Leptotrichia sp.]MBB1534304.1 site-specific DNA-methyltransferase [Leptotrichia sp.]